jgi:carboxyl-terminal processing protease
MKKKYNLKVAKIVLSLIFFINISNKVYSEDMNKLYQKIDLFSEVLEKVQEEYVDEIDQSKVMDSAINGVLQSLDPYSSYMNPEIFQEMQTETSGEFGGLGIEVSMEAGVVKVITPIDDTPASKAGIKSGDYIVRINGEQVQGKTLMEAVNLMRGPVDTSIELTIRRKGLKKAKIFKITRKIIEIKSVTAKLIDKEIGYLRLRSFNENSSNQLKQEITKLEKNKKTIGYILDLRNNPGGLLSQAIRISDFFLNDGEIVSTKGRSERENRKFFAKKGDRLNGKPMIVLINNGSASASEIVAGALQDQKRAILLGESTYGKGSVQSIIPLKNNGAIRLTISKYYLPSGKSISDIGVLPDIKVEEKGEEFTINTNSDNQLNYAIKLLNG